MTHYMFTSHLLFFPLSCPLISFVQFWQVICFFPYWFIRSFYRLWLLFLCHVYVVTFFFKLSLVISVTSLLACFAIQRIYIFYIIESSFENLWFLTLRLAWKGLYVSLNSGNQLEKVARVDSVLVQHLSLDPWKNWIVRAIWVLSILLLVF